MAALNGTSLNGTGVNGIGLTNEAAFLPLAATESTATADSPTPPPDRERAPVVEPWPELEDDELETERAGLEAEIAAARARTAAAKHRAAQRDAEMRAVLRAELEASKEVLATMEREHAVAVALVREAADAEVVRILAEARQRVADVANPPHLEDGHRNAE